MNKQTGHRWVVMKFGGTSVSSVGCWSTICAQARENLALGKRVLIVVSALSGVTSLLTRIALGVSPEERDDILIELRSRHFGLLESLGLRESAEFTRHWSNLSNLVTRTGSAFTDPDRAVLLAHGELLSSSIGQEVLLSEQLDAVWQDARDLLESIPEPGSNVLSVRCGDHEEPALDQRLAAEGQLHITQGFIARSPEGETCLLGRGGSDTSAACLAARLHADSLEIWTDVPGIFSADPRIVPEARLLQRLSYSEAQELASMGAKVLHPASIKPVSQHRIPVFIRDSNRPSAPGTRIGVCEAGEDAQVKGVVSRSNVTLINMENPSMWHQAGFLADVFAVFKSHSFSVDLIATSESSVTVSLDPQVPTSSDDLRMSALLQDLAALCEVSTHTACVSISLVGNAIRTILGRLSAALDVFQDRRVHMVTQSANDLNLTLVVDSDHSKSLVRKLHQLLISSQVEGSSEFGPSWAELTRSLQPADEAEPWWVKKAGELQQLMKRRESAYVYDLDTACAAARRLMRLGSVSRVLYSVKANDHPDLLRALASEGLGFECVSIQEVHHVLETVEGFHPEQVLFTPNFAPRHEYETALEAGVQLTVDNSWALQQWPDVFEGREIFLRLDLDTGYGHHKKVITSGADSKFGIALEHLPELKPIMNQHKIRVTGLHAHTGSGVINAEVWQEQLLRFTELLSEFPDVRVLDLGGGLGVPDRRGRAGFDLARLDELLSAALAGHDVELWLEPGRYLVAESGVLLSRVTQLKTKGRHHYLGVNTGMNSLIRPALYGAYHDIFNLSRLHEPVHSCYRVVGPVCESGDVLGESRYLPRSEEGDIILIANTGAYGRVMSSSYNRRKPASELLL